MDTICLNPVLRGCRHLESRKPVQIGAYPNHYGSELMARRFARARGGRGRHFTERCNAQPEQPRRVTWTGNVKVLRHGVWNAAR